MTVADGVTYIITGGGEGVIKIWKFDQPSSKFEVISTLEGHIRDVTCLHLFGKNTPFFIFFCVNVCISCNKS